MQSYEFIQGRVWLNTRVVLFFALLFAISVAEGDNAVLDTTVSSLSIEHTYQETFGSQVIYNITIKNSGDIKIKDTAVTDALPANMAYISSNYLFQEDGTLEEPVKITNSEGTTLTWSIGDLVSDQSKTIQLMVIYTGEASGASRSKVIAIGSALGNPVVTSPVEAQEDIGPLG